MFDAWPVVEYYAGNDPSAAEVEKLLSSDSTAVVISAVNYAEVYAAIATITRDFSAGDDFMESLKGVLSVVDPSPEVSALAALVKHCYLMSLGDCFAAATAISLSSGLWPWKEQYNPRVDPASHAELCTGDCELICENRVWQVRDLRTEDQRKLHS